ncbi:MAG TPA: DUF3105 domain-containing protein [Thermomicrobiales bacterium]
MRRSVIAVAVVALALLPALVVLQGDAQQATPVAGTPDDGVIPGLFTFDVPSREHEAGHIDYPQSPPVGGPHNPVFQNCGFYDQPVGNEHAVHSLEHGAVWITYRPDLPADQIATLRDLAAQQDYLLVSPYPGLPAPIVASAWGTQLWLDTAADPRLGQFIELYAGNGPELGGPCAGGTSETFPLATPATGSPEATPAA